jgi:hypothetical protein
MQPLDVHNLYFKDLFSVARSKDGKFQVHRNLKLERMEQSPCCEISLGDSYMHNKSTHNNALFFTFISCIFLPIGHEAIKTQNHINLRLFRFLTSNLARDRDWRRAFVNTVMNFLFTKMHEKSRLLAPTGWN